MVAHWPFVATYVFIKLLKPFLYYNNKDEFEQINSEGSKMVLNYDDNCYLRRILLKYFVSSKNCDLIIKLIWHTHLNDAISTIKYINY